MIAIRPQLSRSLFFISTLQPRMLPQAVIANGSVYANKLKFVKFLTLLTSPSLLLKSQNMLGDDHFDCKDWHKWF